MRSIAANGSSRVIPVQAGIQEQKSSNPEPR
jgi:hypothetical protein